MLIRLFSSATRVSLLTLFFTRLDKRFYVRELARQLGRDISGVKRELDNLERAGLLTSEKVGNLRYYTVNKASPLYAEMKGIIAKTTGVHGSVRDGLRRIKGIKTAILYGTDQREPEEGLGAIRLMIIGQVDLNDVNDSVTALESRLGREISYLVFDEAEFRRRKAEDDPFLVEVLKGQRAMVIGTDDGL
ncbi:MAG: winged helix-turn-helix transcriptional regulator [Candidatus Methylomirabilis oxyfera]|nr:winged helix-turn-helix transcriptional regulator [Candidatus Methylomirabilis oxyfera]